MVKRQGGFPCSTYSFDQAAHSKLQRWTKSKPVSWSCQHHDESHKNFLTTLFSWLCFREYGNMTTSILQHINLAVITACLWLSQHRVSLWSNGAWQPLPFPSTSKCSVAMPFATGKVCASAFFIYLVVIWGCVTSHKIISFKNVLL